MLYAGGLLLLVWVFQYTSTLCGMACLKQHIRLRNGHRCLVKRILLFHNITVSLNDGASQWSCCALIIQTLMWSWGDKSGTYWYLLRPRSRSVSGLVLGNQTSSMISHYRSACELQCTISQPEAGLSKNTTYLGTFRNAYAQIHDVVQPLQRWIVQAETGSIVF